jgi:hypothetical protein
MSRDSLKLFLMTSSNLLSGMNGLLVALLWRSCAYERTYHPRIRAERMMEAAISCGNYVYTIEEFRVIWACH